MLIIPTNQDFSKMVKIPKQTLIKEDKQNAHSHLKGDNCQQSLEL